LTSQYKLDNIASASEHPGEGYRSLANLMIDENFAFASPLKVYRVLEKENHLNRFNNVKKNACKNRGFQQSEGVNQHCYSNIKCVKFHNFFLLLTTVINGFSRLYSPA